MADDVEEFAPVTRLDPARVTARLAAEAGVELAVDGHSTAGQVGAAYVRWPDGHRSVLTYAPGPALALCQATATNLHYARRAGVPAPEYELVVDLGDEVALVQQLLPGSPPEQVDVDLIEQMLTINHRMYRILAGAADIATVPLHLTESGPGFCLHEPLQAHNDRTRRLLGWVHEVGASVPPMMAGDDLVHVDYHPGNVLVHDGVISGVVDWVGAARGDARFAIVVMRFAGGLSDQAIARIDRALEEELTEEELRPYWAALSLRLVDWSIRHFTDADTERWLDLAESRVG